MPRVVSLFLPTWPTDRMRRHAGTSAPSADTPLILVGRDGNRRVVTAVDVAGYAAGLRPGMPATKAKILVPGLIVRDADPSADAEALDRLAVWLLQRFAPVVAADPPDGIVIDSTGADHLYGGEPAMIETLIGRVALSGVAARAAVADTFGAAHALARHTARPTFVAEPGHNVALIKRLPLEALRPVLADRCRPAHARLRAHRRSSQRTARTPHIAVRSRTRAPHRPGGRHSRRADRAGPMARPNRCTAGLRRADRRGRDDRAICRQARRRAMRSTRGKGFWRAASRSGLSPRRQSCPGSACGHRETRT